MSSFERFPCNAEGSRIMRQCIICEITINWTRPFCAKCAEGVASTGRFYSGLARFTHAPCIIAEITPDDNYPRYTEAWELAESLGWLPWAGYTHNCEWYKPLTAFGEGKERLKNIRRKLYLIREAGWQAAIREVEEIIANKVTSSGTIMIMGEAEIPGSFRYDPILPPEWYVVGISSSTMDFAYLVARKGVATPESLRRLFEICDALIGEEGEDYLDIQGDKLVIFTPEPGRWYGRKRMRFTNLQKVLGQGNVQIRQY